MRWEAGGPLAFVPDAFMDDPEETKDGLRGSYRRLAKLDTRDQSGAVFAIKGFNDAKVQDIALAADIALGTLYKAFSGKEEIYQGLLKTRTAKLMEFATTIDPQASTKEIVLNGIAAYVRFFLEHPNFLKIHLNLGHAWALEAGLIDVQTEYWQQGIQTLTAMLAQGAAAGDFIGEDPELMARMMTAMTQVRLAMWVKQGMVDSAEKVIQNIQQYLVRTFCPTEGKHAKKK